MYGAENADENHDAAVTKMTINQPNGQQKSLLDEASAQPHRERLEKELADQNERVRCPVLAWDQDAGPEETSSNN